MEDLALDTITSSFAVKIEAPDVITTEEVHIISTLPAVIENVASGSTTFRNPRKLTSFKCYICAEYPKFDTKASLNEHLSTFHQKNAYECEECNITSCAAKNINYHLSRHDAIERPYKCSACPMRFVQESLKKRHEISMHMMSDGYSVPFDKKCCVICGKKFSAEPSLQMHMRRLHQEIALKNRFCCYLCNTDSGFDDNNSLEEHLAATHPEQESYNCTECNITLNGRTVFNCHLSTHDALVKPYKCTICPRRFKSQTSKHLHEYYHNSGRENVPEYQSKGQTSLKNCQIELPNCANLPIKAELQTCDAIKTEEVHFNDELPPDESSSNHSVVQTPETPVVNIKLICCYLCSPATQFKDSASLYEHLSTHSLQENYNCKDCDKSFNNILGYNAHRKRHDSNARLHIGIKSSIPSSKKRLRPVPDKETIKCYLCSNYPQFKDKASLNIHVLSVHVDQDTFECTDCNKTIQSAITYNLHLARHDAGIRPVKCSICSLRFRFQKDLLRHESTQHNINKGGEEP